MRRRVSFRLECARTGAARLRRRSFREISRGFVKVFCGGRARGRASSLQLRESWPPPLEINVARSVHPRRAASRPFSASFLPYRRPTPGITPLGRPSSTPARLSARRARGIPRVWTEPLSSRASISGMPGILDDVPGEHNCPLREPCRAGSNGVDVAFLTTTPILPFDSPRPRRRGRIRAELVRVAAPVLEPEG